MSIRIITSKASRGRKTIFKGTAAELLTTTWTNIDKVSTHHCKRMQAINTMSSYYCLEKKRNMEQIRRKNLLVMQTHWISSWLELNIMREFCFLTIHALEVYTKKQFECNKQRHSNHSMAWGPLFKEKNMKTKKCTCAKYFTRDATLPFCRVILLRCLRKSESTKAYMAIMRNWWGW